MIHSTEKFFYPDSLETAWELYNKEPKISAYISGGVSINWRGNRFKNLISVLDLVSKGFSKDFLFLGGGTLLSDFENIKMPYSYLDVLKEACNSVATPQIRNMATIGGNLISHFDFSDTLGFFYLTEPETLVYNGTKENFISFFNKENINKRWKIDSGSILLGFRFDKNILAKYISGTYIKYSKMGRDIATIGMTLFRNVDDSFDIALMGYGNLVACYRNVGNSKDICKKIKETTKAKSDLRAPDHYREEIIEELISRGMEKCRK